MICPTVLDVADLKLHNLPDELLDIVDLAYVVDQTRSVKGLRINEEKLARPTSHPFQVLGKLKLIYLDLFMKRARM